MKSPARIIKKYPNRRLYDATAGKYVNLEDVAALVREGVEVAVVDARSGKDLTRSVLTQIVVEGAKGEPSALPLELLRELVIATDHAGQEFMTWYLKSAVEAYQKVHESVQSRLFDVRSAALAPLQTVKNFLTPSAGSDGEIEELRRRVAELEARTPRRRTKKKP